MIRVGLAVTPAEAAATVCRLAGMLLPLLALVTFSWGKAHQENLLVNF